MTYQIADRLERLVKILREMSDDEALTFGRDELRRILMDTEPLNTVDIEALRNKINTLGLGKIAAIKCIRFEYRCGLKEAIELFERCFP